MHVVWMTSLYRIHVSIVYDVVCGILYHAIVFVLYHDFIIFILFLMVWHIMSSTYIQCVYYMRGHCVLCYVAVLYYAMLHLYIAALFTLIYHAFTVYSMLPQCKYIISLLRVSHIMFSLYIVSC